MKKWAAFLFFCLLTDSFSQINISPQFSELNGMEDQQGNTHLFYRIYSYEETTYGYISDNSIYHLDFNAEIDSLFFREFIDNSYVSFFLISVGDIDFWNENPSQFIFGGTWNLDGVPSLYIRRFENPFQFPNILELGEIKHIDIADNNDSLIYVGLGENSSALSLGSTDGGWNWNPVFDTLKFISLNQFNDNFLFLENLVGFLYRSTDAGNSFHLTDLLNQPSHSTSFIYDPDQSHIYRLYSNQTLRVSPDNGEPFSWQTKYSSDSRIFISNDESVSGTIYLADKKNILISTNYGDNFALYRSLDRKIVGIYKKPDSNKLYAATKYKIYEITPDTIQVVKSLPIPEEVLNFYPLATGNKWVYDVWGWWADTAYHSYSGITFREVVGDTVMTNGLHYYKLFDPTTFNYPPYLFERIDSSSGKVYRYDETLGLTNDEYLIDDLLAEVGDTIYSSRHQYQDNFPFICIDEGIFDKWGIQGPRKIFTIFDLTGYTYSLSQGAGIDSIYNSFDFGENFATLKGCIVNGVIYGDTTVVSVENEETPIATSFKLEQNYPNPFNPSTKIKFTISQSPLPGGDGRGGLVTLKVYDILGNEVANLLNEELPAGEYEVDFSTVGGQESSIQNPASGIYFYQLRAGDFIQTKKMILLK